MYSPELLDHFEHPRNAGTVLAPDAVAQCENPVCGDVLKLSAKFVGGTIAEIKFQAKGCVPAMGCGSALTELMTGRTLDDAERIKKADIIRVLGELPPASGHAADLAIETLAALVAQLRPKSSR